MIYHLPVKLLVIARAFSAVQLKGTKLIAQHHPCCLEPSQPGWLFVVQGCVAEAGQNCHASCCCRFGALQPFPEQLVYNGVWVLAVLSDG